MKGLSPGTMTLLVGSGLLGGRTMTKSVEIPKGVASVETTIEFPRGNVVKGAVTRGGQPVAGASVIFRNGGTRATTTASTDADGHYTAEDVDSGEYDVNVIQFSSGLSHATKVKVDGDEDFDVELPLRKLSGRVTEAGSDRPLDGATISINKAGEKGPSAGAGFLFRFAQGVKTDATGQFRLEGLEEGSFDLTARKEGYAFGQRRVDILDGAEPDEVVFELSPSEGFAFRATDLKSNLALNSLSVLAVPAGALGGPFVQRGNLSADASGLFHLSALKPGEYDVVLGGDRLATENLRVEVPSAAKTIQMVPGGNLEIHADHLTDTQIARGVLLDQKSRTIVRTNTSFTDPGFELRAATPLTLRDVKPGAYLVELTMPDGSRSELAVTVTAGADAKVSFP